MAGSDEPSVRLPGLVASVLGCELAGVLGALATAEGVSTWYPTLRKPAFTPPGWVFGPVWTLLYALMGMALHLATGGDREAGTVRAARRLFALQLALNVLWSYLFFGRRRPGWALVEIACLWTAILLTVRSFAALSRPAALLLLPYLAWVSFAAVLNGAIWRLNAPSQ